MHFITKFRSKLVFEVDEFEKVTSTKQSMQNRFKLMPKNKKFLYSSKILFSIQNFDNILVTRGLL